MSVPTSTVPTVGVSITEVSRMLGVPMPTLRSWERRYGIPAAERQAGRHRRYGPDELHALRLMRDEVARGHAASVAAASVRALLSQDGPAAVHIAWFLEAGERTDRRGIADVLDAATAELGLGPTLDDVLLPAMRQIGLWWQVGRCDIEQEREITAAARAWLVNCAGQAPAPHRPQPILLACGPTDLHTIGLESLGALLRHHGWDCRVLGPRLPTAVLRNAIVATSSAVVVVVSHLNSGRNRAIASMRAAEDLGMAVFYAGNAFSSPRSRRSVPGSYLGIQLQDACAIIENAG